VSRRSLFCPLVGAGAVLEAVSAGLLATAIFSDAIPRGWTDYAPMTETDVFSRVTSLSWSTDRGLLVAAIVFGALGVVAYATAARAR
jgi:hypothetical protein